MEPGTDVEDVLMPSIYRDPPSLCIQECHAAAVILVAHP